jgi:hypothetical protein
MFKIKQLTNYTIENDRQYDDPDISYVSNCDEFFDIKYLQTKDDLILLKDKIVDKLSNKYLNISNIKLKYYNRLIETIYLYIDYIEYFEKRYGKKTYRFIGKKLPDINLEYEKTIAKASNMKSILKNTFDGGFVDYWAFNDYIVIRTIKRLKKDMNLEIL